MDGNKTNKTTKPIKKSASSKKSSIVWVKPKFIIPITILFIFITISISSYSGFQTGATEKNVYSKATVQAQLIDEYFLALEEIEDGFYDRAIQRLSYVYDQDPSFDLAFDKWVEIQAIMNATATPTLVPPTPTPTPTRSTHDQAELFAQAEQQLAEDNWSGMIDTLAYLRMIDPEYMQTEVDGMMYVALIARGSYRIVYLGELQKGLYDFTLAEQFGPLSYNSLSYREWARYYLIGNGFWMAAPDTAAYYYGQVVNMAPNLRDTTGMTAFNRYWQSLIQHADNMATQSDWCEAQNYYDQAMNAQNDSSIQPTAVYVGQQCLYLTATATPFPTATPTVDPNITLTPIFTETPVPIITTEPTEEVTVEATEETPTP